MLKPSKQSPLFILGLFLLLTLSGCAVNEVRGYPLDQEKLARIEVGKTTSEEVMVILGSPTTISTFDSNVWYYIGQRTIKFGFLSPSILSAVSVAVSFNEEGVVESLEQWDQESIREVAFSKRVTPTKGHDISLFEILFANIGLGQPQSNSP